jgi:cholinesterase
MRNVSTDAIFAAVPTSGINALLSPFGPTVDGTLVFANYSALPAPDIPLLVGSNEYEAGLFRTELALGGVAFADSDWEELNLSSYTCPIGQRANASYIASTSTTSTSEEEECTTSSSPVWRYRFFGVFPNVNISSEAGAFHGIELQLLFGTTFSTPADTPAEILVEKYIQGAWTTFAKDPVNGLKSYEGGWPTYDPSEKTLIRLAYGNELGDGTNLEFPWVYDAGCAEASLADLLCRIFGECSL